MLEFISPVHTRRGDALQLLEKAYASFQTVDAQRYSAWHDAWIAFDLYIYQNTESASRWLFFSRYKSKLAGFCSWDPLRFPQAIMGHNCIDPQFQGNGYGATQMKHALSVLRNAGYVSVDVQTGVEKFFAPARAMYTACGFTFVGEKELTKPETCRVAEFRITL